MLARAFEINGQMSLKSNKGGLSGITVGDVHLETRKSASLFEMGMNHT
jgi:hypothetical protein